MCGIAGIASPSIGLAHRDLLAMSARLRHRGPDGEGFYLYTDRDGTAYAGKDSPDAITARLDLLPEGRSAGLGLLHRRLSILDLSVAGHQPMVSRQGHLVLSFNGEIYNYKEIALEYGYDCTSGSDTEVMLAHLSAKGPDAVKDFRGMWAFALLDTRSNSLLLSRDRFGIKPLYYAPTEDGLAFASEIKALFEVEGIRPIVKRSTLAQFVSYGTYEQTYAVPFEGIEALSPGCNMIIDLNAPSIGMKMEKYYDPSTIVGSSSIEEYHEVFRESIKMHMRADVPVGSCLSGGLDSSALVMEAAALTDGPFHTFTAAYHDPAIDESDYARMLTGPLPQLRQHFTYPGPEGVIADWDKMIEHQDLPVGSSSIYAQWDVMRSARENGMTVLLDGQGADELLGGYYNFAGLLVIEKIRKLRLVGAANAYKDLKDNFTPAMRQALMRAAFAYVPDSLKASARRSQRLGPSLLSTSYGDFLSDVRSPERNGRTMKSHSLLSMQQGMYELLRYEDRNSMSFHIESRVPFLDHKVVETSLRLDADDLIRKGWTKWPIRQLLDKRLPDELVWRKDKKGFLTPQQAWKDALEPMMTAKIAASTHDFVDKEKMVDLLRRPSLSNSQLSELWRLYSVSRWLEIFAIEII